MSANIYYKHVANLIPYNDKFKHENKIGALFLSETEWWYLITIDNYIVYTDII